MDTPSISLLVLGVPVEAHDAVMDVLNADCQRVLSRLSR